MENVRNLEHNGCLLVGHVVSSDAGSAAKTKLPRTQTQTWDQLFSALLLLLNHHNQCTSSLVSSWSISFVDYMH